MWWHKAIAKTETVLCFVFFCFLSPWDSFLPLFIFASKNTIEYAPLQGGSHWLVRAVSQVWPGTETQHTGDSPSGCCRASRCEEFPGWQGSQRKRGGSMTGTLASRCRLGDNAALINFLFFCHNDRRRWSHDKMESWIKKKIGGGWDCREELRTSPH